MRAGRKKEKKIFHDYLDKYKSLVGNGNSRGANRWEDLLTVHAFYKSGFHGKNGRKRKSFVCSF